LLLRTERSRRWLEGTRYVDVYPPMSIVDNTCETQQVSYRAVEAGGSTCTEVFVHDSAAGEITMEEMDQAIPLLAYRSTRTRRLSELGIRSTTSLSTHALVEMSSFSFTTSVNLPYRSSLDSSFRFTSARSASSRLSRRPFQSKSSFSAASSRSSIKDDAEREEALDVRLTREDGPALACRLGW
jgi:hypothetical protein